MVEFVVALVGAAVLAWAVVWLEMIPWRRSLGRHWTERARRLYPARVARVQSLVFAALVMVLLCDVLFDNVSWWAAGAGGLLGTIAVGYPFERRFNPELNFRRWIHVLGATMATQFLRVGLFLLALFTMPWRFNGRAWLIAAAFLGAQLALQFGLGIRLLRWLRILQPASPRLLEIVDETCTRAGVAVRGVWEAALPQANAIAFVTTRELAFTPKLLGILSDEEIAAVCAHELGHISESRWTLWGRVVGALSPFPLIFVRPAEMAFGPAAIFPLLIVTFLLFVGRARLGRAMEKRADTIAARHSENDAVYARALEKIYEANHMPAVMRKNPIRLHPDLYDRMVAANVTPDYPRPAPPRRIAWSTVALIAAAVALGAFRVVR